MVETKKPVKEDSEGKVLTKTGDESFARKDKEKADQDAVVNIPTYAENRLGAHQNFEEGRLRQKKHAEEVAEKKRVERAEAREKAEKEAKKK